MPNDIPNTLLAKIMSFDFLGILIVLGISWGTLTNKVNGLETHVEEVKTEQAYQNLEAQKTTKDMDYRVFELTRKVDVIGNNQDHFKEQIGNIDDKLEKIQELLEKAK